MSKLDEMKKNYENIEIPEELKERVDKGVFLTWSIPSSLGRNLIAEDLNGLLEHFLCAQQVSGANNEPLRPVRRFGQ